MPNVHLSAPAGSSPPASPCGATTAAGNPCDNRARFAVTEHVTIVGGDGPRTWSTCGTHLPAVVRSACQIINQATVTLLP